MNNELINEVKKAKTPDELIAIAKEKGITLTTQNAEEILQRFGVNREVADDELDNVSGGCGSDDAPIAPVCPKCGVGHIVEFPLAPGMYRCNNEDCGYIPML